MKTYIVNIESRKGDRNYTLGPYTTFEKARAAFSEHDRYWTEEVWKEYTEYGSSYDEGTLYTEEETVEIYERELI